MGRSAGVSPEAPDNRAGVPGVPGDSRVQASRQADSGDQDGPDIEIAAEPIRTLIVDDHALFRRGLEMVLEAEPDIELVGEASDGEEAVSKAAESVPDVVLADIRMPRSSGIEALPGHEGPGTEQSSRS